MNTCFAMMVNHLQGQTAEADVDIYSSFKQKNDLLIFKIFGTLGHKTNPRFWHAVLWFLPDDTKKYYNIFFVFHKICRISMDSHIVVNPHTQANKGTI